MGEEVSSQMVLSGENLFLWFLGSQLRKAFGRKQKPRWPFRGHLKYPITDAPPFPDFLESTKDKDSLAS